MYKKIAMTATCTVPLMVDQSQQLIEEEKKIFFSYNMATELHHKTERHKAKLTAGSYGECLFLLLAPFVACISFPQGKGP